MERGLTFTQPESSHAVRTPMRVLAAWALIGLMIGFALSLVAHERISAAPVPPDTKSAVKKCSLPPEKARLIDDGDILMVHMDGEADGLRPLSSTESACLFREMDVPSGLQSRLLEDTDNRAIEASVGKYDFGWSRRSQDGLAISFTLTGAYHSLSGKD